MKLLFHPRHRVSVVVEVPSMYLIPLTVGILILVLQVDRIDLDYINLLVIEKNVEWDGHPLNTGGIKSLTSKSFAGSLGTVLTVHSVSLSA